jgi:septal ring factor EnvC (AmiA/AmiB activator)
MNARHLSTLLALLLAPILAAHAAGPTDKGPARIKKCQDAQGKWHYGDTADDLCAKSKVIELDKSGVQRKVIAAPKTAAELKALEETQLTEEKAKKDTEEQAKRDQQLLAAYTHEEDITTTRDRKLKEVGEQIKATEDTIKSLQKSLERLQSQAAEDQRAGRPIPAPTAKSIANNESQIAKHEANIARWRKDQETMKAQYQSDLERFREAKNRQALTLPPKTPAATPPAGTAPAKK